MDTFGLSSEKFSDQHLDNVESGRLLSSLRGWNIFVAPAGTKLQKELATQSTFRWWWSARQRFLFDWRSYTSSTSREYYDSMEVMPAHSSDFELLMQQVDVFVILGFLSNNLQLSSHSLPTKATRVHSCTGDSTTLFVSCVILTYNVRTLVFKAPRSNESLLQYCTHDTVR